MWYTGNDVILPLSNQSIVFVEGVECIHIGVKNDDGVSLAKFTKEDALYLAELLIKWVDSK